MNTQGLSWFAIGLWVPSLIVATVFFIRRQMAPSTDGPREIALSSSDRDVTIMQAYTLLLSMHGFETGMRQHNSQANASRNKLLTTLSSTQLSGVTRYAAYRPAVSKASRGRQWA